LVPFSQSQSLFSGGADQRISGLSPSPLVLGSSFIGDLFHRSFAIWSVNRVRLPLFFLSADTLGWLHDCRSSISASYFFTCKFLPSASWIHFPSPVGVIFLKDPLTFSLRDAPPFPWQILCTATGNGPSSAGSQIHQAITTAPESCDRDLVALPLGFRLCRDKNRFFFGGEEFGRGSFPIWIDGFFQSSLQTLELRRLRKSQM